MSKLLEDVDNLEDDPGVGLVIILLVSAEARGVYEDHWPAGVSPPHPLPDIINIIRRITVFRQKIRRLSEYIKTKLVMTAWPGGPLISCCCILIPEARGECAGLGLVTDVKEDLRVARAVEDEIEEGGLALPGLADGGDYEPLVRVGGELDHSGAGHSLQQIVSIIVSSLSQDENTHCDLFLAREEVCDNGGVMQDVSVRYAGG